MTGKHIPPDGKDCQGSGGDYPHDFMAEIRPEVLSGLTLCMTHGVERVSETRRSSDSSREGRREGSAAQGFGQKAYSRILSA